jgi:hypothetical protein
MGDRVRVGVALRDVAMTGQTVTVDTGHGVYDALPACEADEAPGGATHVVLHESGERAGYAADGGWSWDVAGVAMPFRRLTLAHAVWDVAHAHAGQPS